MSSRDVMPCDYLGSITCLTWRGEGFILFVLQSCKRGTSRARYFWYPRDSSPGATLDTRGQEICEHGILVGLTVSVAWRCGFWWLRLAWMRRICCDIVTLVHMFP